MASSAALILSKVECLARGFIVGVVCPFVGEVVAVTIGELAVDCVVACYRPFVKPRGSASRPESGRRIFSSSGSGGMRKIPPPLPEEGFLCRKVKARKGFLPRATSLRFADGTARIQASNRWGHDRACCADEFGDRVAAVVDYPNVTRGVDGDAER